MARIKYYDSETQSWKYADTVLGVKGDDYVLTDADKEEIKQSVLDALPVYNGGVS